MSIRKNTIINLTGAIVLMAVMLITVPLYLELLGEARYGVLALVWLVLGYFSFLEMGLGKATANQIAKTNEGAAAERSEIFWTALLMNAGMGVIAAGILWLVGDYLLTNVLKMPEYFRLEALAALPWMITTLPLVLTSSVLNGALEGRSQFVAVNLLQVIGNAVFQVAPLLIAYVYGPTLEFVIATAVISRALMNVAALVTCQGLVLRGAGFAFSTARLRILLSFGGWIAVTGIAGPILETVDRFVIGATLGAKAVAHFVIPYQLAAALRVLPAALSRALFPRFSAQGDDKQHLAMKALRALTVVMTPSVILVMLLLDPFMQAWVGPEVAETAVPLGRVFLLGIWMNSLAYVPLSMLQGTGKPDLVAKIHLLEIVPFLAVLYLAIGAFGLYGAAAAWALRVAADTALMFIAARLHARVWRLVALPCAMLVGCVLLVSIRANGELQWLFFGGVSALLVGVVLWILRSELAKTLLSTYAVR